MYVTKVVTENQKNGNDRKYGNKRNFYINLHLNDGLGMVFTACWGELIPEEALTQRHHLP